MTQPQIEHSPPRQSKEFKAGGSRVWRKVRTSLPSAIFLAIVLLPALLVLIVVRLIRPIVLIRFGSLRGDRLGHMAGETELYLSERDVGMQASGAVDLMFFNSRICNKQLKKMAKRALHVSPLAQPLYRLNRFLPGSKSHTVTVFSRDVNNNKDIHGVIAQTQAHLTFTVEEELAGKKALATMGVPDGATIVCFTNRDSAYLNAMYSDRDWSYQDYRDCAIQNFEAATEELTGQGYYLIRVGSVVSESLSTSNPMIIDYASEYRSDFLDIYLAAHCAWFLAANTGINMLPVIFRRPMAQVNYVPLVIPPCWGPNDLFIPKKIWVQDQNRFMNFREIANPGPTNFLQTKQFQELGLEPVENSPREISSLAREMEERLQGTWITSEEDEELQQRFWAIFDRSVLRDSTLCRIGAEFLRENQELLS